MKRANDADRLLVKAALIKRDDPFMSLQEAARIAAAGETVWVEGKDPATAYVNEGRWVANCPACPGAELVAEGHDMLCGSCGTNSKVVWPKDHKEIERLLGKRMEQNQSWWPHQRVDELAAENIEHGIMEI